MTLPGHGVMHVGPSWNGTAKHLAVFSIPDPHPDTNPRGITPISGSFVQFSPTGALLLETSRLVLQYDSTAIPSGVDPTRLRIIELRVGTGPPFITGKYFDRDVGVTIDAAAHTLTLYPAKVLTMFGIGYQ